ncbi:MAG TPA: sugar kinase [Solirubrobacteraceae bacterium]|jgi:2-dehydro-3-deoxygluconokinase|nr:sugar kinase [Solirubrobacteraceae bacterium]
MEATASHGGLVTAGETMGLVVQQSPGSPRNGEPMSFGIGGSESNVAIGVRRLGVPATWIGRVGADPPGHLIQRELRAERIEVIATTDPAPTGLMIRWRPTAMHGRVDYYRRDGAGSHLRTGDIPGDAIRRAAVFHATGITLALGADPAAAILEAMALARNSGTTVSFDLNYRRALWSTADAAPALTAAVRGADVVFAGAEEAAIVAGTGEPAAAARAIAAMGPSQVLIKLGADGCLALIDGAQLTLSAPAVTVLDTVGAGDAFVAGYLAELIAGAAPARRVATAVAAGALAVTVSGDWEGLPDRTALELLSSREPVIR